MAYRGGGRKGGESSSSPRKIARAEKIAEAVTMRKRGVDYATIGRKLGVNANTASHWVNKHMAELPQEAGGELRKLEIERLDQLLDAMWDKAMNGSEWAVDRCVKIMERKAKLAGIDAPVVTKVEVVPNDVVQRQIADMERQAQIMRATVENEAAKIQIESTRIDRQAGGE